MAEYYRDATHQFCDADLCYVIDTHTGVNERIFCYGSAIVRFSEALDWLVNRGNKQRHAIIKIQCVGAFPLKDD